MAATTFGGSFNLVRSHSRDFRKLITSKLYRAAIHENLPFAKYIPFMPPLRLPEFDDKIDNILAKEERRKENVEYELRGEKRRRDPLQVS